MHEIGVLCQVMKEVTKVARENDLDHVDGIVLEIGELTGMVPEFFTEYFDMVAEDYPVCSKAKLTIETVKGMGRCWDCGEVYDVAENEGVCPRCGSRGKDILSGRQFIVKEILVGMETDEQEKTA